MELCFQTIQAMHQHGLEGEQVMSLFVEEIVRNWK